MILLIILLQSTCFIRNIMEGLIWFVLPSSLVIFNDIMARRPHARDRGCSHLTRQAYIFGFFSAGVHLRLFLRPHAAHQALAQEDVGGCASQQRVRAELPA